MTALNAQNLTRLAHEELAVPQYDRSAITVGIVHFGVGGFHRAHEAMYVDALMNKGHALDWGICGVGLLPGDARMRDVLREQDCLYTLMVKAPDGSRTARVIGSIVNYLFAPDDPEAVLDRMTAPETRIVSLTVTEAGYNVHRVTGDFDVSTPGVAADLQAGASPSTVFGYIVEALARRRAAGTEPFTVMSCDNVQGNGHVAQHAITAFAAARDPELAAWIENCVHFPNSMVDRITPATTPADTEAVHADFDITDGWPVVCEPFTQWVLEDSFGTGRPEFDRVGVQLVSDVEPYELMKLRLLNAGHQALGYAGYLAGYRYVHEASHDPVFIDLLKRYMIDEALPSLRPVPGIDLPAYVDELLERFGNPEVRDTLARLCVDTSERIPKFLLPVLRYQLQAGGPIDCATAVVASWARYAEGVDEEGEPIEVVDPIRDQLTAAATQYPERPLAFLEVREIFGELADDDRFTGRYRELLDQLHEQGAHATLTALVTR